MIFFSVLIVTYAREELLSKCLDSLRLDRKDWELIIVANGSQLSKELILKAQSLTTHFHLIDTQTLVSPGKARNLGLKAVRGEWIFFIDDDAYLLPHYWETVFPLLTEPKIDVLGGPDTAPPGMSVLPLSLSLSLSSPFCTGPTFSRHQPQGKRIRTADENMLSSCNLWVRKSVVEDLTFPEDYIRGEETLFLLKLKQLERGFYYHPNLKVAHFRRAKISMILRSTFYAGFYRSRTMRLKLKGSHGMFWLPAIFVLLHGLFFLDDLVFLYFARMYLSIILFVSLSLAMRVKKISLFPLIAFLHYFIVFIYGSGILAERLRRKK